MTTCATSIAVLATWLAISPAAARSETYPQLISTQYDRRAGLPAGATKPILALETVDRSKLPDGAIVSATAKSASGRIWLLTNHGPFRATADGYEPLVVGPRVLEPGQPELRGSARMTALVADHLGHCQATLILTPFDLY